MTNAETEIAKPAAVANPSSVTLGVVAICYNEQTDITGFLQHLVSWVDEIVLIDDGSTDSTQEIASSYGDKVKFVVSPRKEGEYFSHQRNKGIALAESDWLLHMDIDERVPPVLAQEILSAIENPQMDGFRFRRLNYFMHRAMSAGGWQSWNLVHLARRDLFHFEGMFHEKCVLNSSEDRTGQLKEKIFHLNESEFKKRLDKSGVYQEELTSRVSSNESNVNFMDILFRPLMEFIKHYILKRGFKDGTPGLISAIHSATALFRAYALVWDEQHAIPREVIEADIQSLWQESTKDTVANSRSRD